MRNNTMFLKNTLKLYKIKRKEKFTKGKTKKQKLLFLLNNKS